MSDVAKLAGVSKMTISRVLNQSPHVTEETRVRVLHAIDQLQYQRNEIARSLRDHTSRQIGIMVPNLYDPFFSTCAHAVSLVARAHDYSVVLSTSDENQQTEYAEASRMLRRNLDGLVLIPALPSTSAKGAPSLLDPEFSRLPIVTLDRPVAGSHFDSLLVENKRGARLGTRHLIDLGHKEIACFALSSRLYTMNQRQAGYREAMRAARLESRVSIVSDALEATVAEIDRVMSSGHPPSAIFCANNLTTRHVLHGLYALGIHPPGKVALVGFDDFEIADLLRPGITVVRQPVETMGRLAGEMLFARLGKDTSQASSGPAKHIVLPVELVVRGSCGAKV